MAYPVLRHRLFTNFNADAEGIDVDQVIEKILQTVPEPSLRRSPAEAATAESPRTAAGNGASSRRRHRLRSGLAAPAAGAMPQPASGTRPTAASISRLAGSGTAASEAE